MNIHNGKLSLTLINSIKIVISMNTTRNVMLLNAILGTEGVSIFITV